ncbi:unnamed protein product [Calypogeia fissa]
MGRVRKESPVPVPASVLIPSLLHECQHTLACHPRAIKQLVECRKNDFAEFVEVWIRVLRPMFLVWKREPAVERIVNLASSFTAYCDEELARDCEKFFESFLATLLDWTEAAHKSVRFRACQMISEVVSKLVDTPMEVREQLWDRMTASMQTRMQDKQTIVRVFAASALSKLVDGEDIDNDLTVQTFRKALASDPSAEVRKMVVKSMPRATVTVFDIVQRIADVSESVRKTAYQYISEKLPANALSITQRAMTIRRGLSERIPAVRQECEKLLGLWLREDCESDPLKLLRFLDVETYEKVGEMAITELLTENLIEFNGTGLRKFLDTSGNERLLMSAEEALFWRVVCTHIHSEAKTKGREAVKTGGAEAVVNAAVADEHNEYLESILLPTVSDFVRLVENHLHKGSVAWFGARQLLMIAKLMDYTDSTSRKDAGLLLQRLLTETTPSEDQSNEQSVSDDPTSHEWVGDGLSLGGEESWGNAVADFARHVHASAGEFEEVLAAAVAEVGRPCREGGADERQWLHCLAVTGLLLENITSLDVLVGRAIEPEEIIHSLLLPAVKHLHPEVQRTGVRCLAMFCSLERSPSPRAVEQLRICLQSGIPQVQKMALKGVFDVILCHGAASIDQASSQEPDLGLPTPRPRPPGVHIPDFSGTEAQRAEQSERRALRLPILEILDECLHGEILVEDGQDQTEYINSMIAVAAEGFAKLLLQNKRFPEVRQIQERIVDELLMLYFSDNTIHFPRVKQCLAVFFRIWCSVSAANKRCISALFIPVLRKMWPGIEEKREKPGTVLVARKHATQVAHFMLHLLHFPLISKGKQGGNQNTPDLADDGAVSHEQDSSAPEREEALDEGLETLGVRICVEVKEQARKFTSLSMARKTYTAMLCRVVTLLRFSPAPQENIKALLCCIPRVVEWLPASEKTSLKALEEALARLKDMDESPDNGLTDEELELFMVRMGFHDIFKEESSSDPTTPEPQSETSTRGRRASGVSRASANSVASIAVSTRSLRTTTERQRGRSRSGAKKHVSTNTTRKNLSSVYESSSEESDFSTVSSASSSDVESE